MSTQTARIAKISRKTKETDISLVMNMDSRDKIDIDLPLPFMTHMLNAMAFHGGFGLEIKGTGDIEVDPHHLVEDLGIVLGQALARLFDLGPVARYGHSVIPMDDALSEATIDVCNRPYLVYKANFPQKKAGDFDLFLFREFFHGLASNARINLHLECRYGENAHHMIEGLFKALGRALKEGFASLEEGSTPSTKGIL
ncbi:MAG: imidazoleglycerol-phosphate dehydratase HisB [Spirochaetales bacterium]|nr:imidazoleglycerol-phosphate dehydratase HisB [Spirochaetales bacterium]